jgi:hypothetical protein
VRTPRLRCRPYRLSITGSVPFRPPVLIVATSLTFLARASFFFAFRVNFAVTSTQPARFALAEPEATSFLPWRSWTLTGPAASALTWIR